MTASIVVYHDNLNFEWQGYDDTLSTFVEETLRRVKEFNTTEQEERFNQVKEKLL